MKKIFALIVLFAGINLSANAYITKAEIELILSEVGTSLEKIEQVYVYNTMTYYTDGTHKQSFTEYTKKLGNYVSLTETGIKLTYKPEGTITSIYFIAYSSILTFDAGKDYFSISLAV